MGNATLNTNEYEGNKIAHLNPLRYRGYYWDAESSLYYDPRVKRFLNADSMVFVPGTLGANVFAYCNNNPVNMVDSSGRRPLAVTDNPHQDPPPLPDNYYAGPPERGGGNPLVDFVNDTFGFETKATVDVYRKKTFMDLGIIKLSEVSASYATTAGISKPITIYADPTKGKVGVKGAVGIFTGDLGIGGDGLLSEKGSLKLGDTTYSLSYKEQVVGSSWVLSSSRDGATTGLEFELNKLSLAIIATSPGLSKVMEFGRAISRMPGFA